MEGHPPDRLQAFLYYLMRDVVPTGQIEEVIRKLPDEDDLPTYSAPELQALSYRYALKILPQPPEEQSQGAQAWLEHAPERVLQELMRERSETGHGLTLEELAERAGWDARKDVDVMEAGEVVQGLYERGFVQRDNATKQIMVTSDGAQFVGAER